MKYQLAHAEFYCGLDGKPINTGKFNVIKEFEADDDTDARGIAGELMLSGLTQEHPLPDVDAWRWEVFKK